MIRYLIQSAVGWSDILTICTSEAFFGISAAVLIAVALLIWYLRSHNKS